MISESDWPGWNGCMLTQRGMSSSGSRPCAQPLAWSTVGSLGKAGMQRGHIVLAERQPAAICVYATDARTDGLQLVMQPPIGRAGR